MGINLEALKHFKQSYLIYECNLGMKAIDTAKSALQVSTINED